MRHGVDGRAFGRNTSHRRAMFRNLANEVILREQVITTAEKAKETRRVVDRLITISKSKAPAAQRLAFDRTRNKDVVKKLFDQLAARYEKRAGGYTRVLRVSDTRKGDGAKMAVLELVDHPTLDRRKKVAPVAADKASQEAGEIGAAGNESKGFDPFKKMRKLFKGPGRVEAKKSAPSKEGKSRRKTGD